MLRDDSLEDLGARVLERGAAQQHLATLRVTLAVRERLPGGGAEALAAGLDAQLIEQREAAEELAADLVEVRQRCEQVGQDALRVRVRALDARRDLLLARSTAPQLPGVRGEL